MGKPKNETELIRFLWRRNPKYDIMLLGEVQTKNPFAFKNQKLAWIDIAKVLEEGPLKMKVTDRSCRERVAELLKIHRRNEIDSARASGTSKAEMTELKNLLTSVSELEQNKPDLQMNKLYSLKDKSEAEAIRASALLEISDSDSDNDDINNSANKKPLPKKRKTDESPKSEPSNSSKSDNRRTNPKKDLVTYLERKSKEDIELRKKEIRIRKMEAVNKAAEFKFLETKAKAEEEDRKKFSDFVIKMASCQ